MASDKVKTFTDSNFDSETSKGVVLVDFWASGAVPAGAWRRRSMQLPATTTAASPWPR
jgi:hypothetical protein